MLGVDNFKQPKKGTPWVETKMKKIAEICASLISSILLVAAFWTSCLRNMTSTLIAKRNFGPPKAPKGSEWPRRARKGP